MIDQETRNRRTEEGNVRESREDYEKPAIVYKGKLEAYAIVCTQKVVGCNGGTKST